MPFALLLPSAETLLRYPAGWGLGLTALALLLLGVVCLVRLPHRLRAKRHPTITARQLEELMQGPHPLVVDLRPPERLRKEGHIKGCLPIPLAELGRRVPEVLRQARVPVARPIVLVDEHDPEAHAAADLLRAQGAEWLYVLMDGFHGWRRGGFPIVK